MDARQQRSRDKLARAILTLASQRPANDITAAEVATLARVHRTTLYDHAPSPIALLELVLRTELDAIREQYLAHADRATAASAVAAVTEAVLRHVEQHAAVYRLGLSETSGPASLHPMLSSHFEASIRLLVDNGAVTISEYDAAGLLSPDQLGQMASRFIADGSVGAIAVWLSGPEPRSVPAFMHAYRQLLPMWWPLSD